MSIIYGNPGFYQFLPNLTSDKLNDNSSNYSNVGSSIALTKSPYYHVVDDIRLQNVYIKFDVFQRIDYSELGVNTSDNSSGFARIGLDNDSIPYIDFVLKNKVLYVRKVDKTNFAETLFTVSHMEMYENVVMTFELHLNLAQEKGIDIIELYLNNVLVGSKSDMNLFNKAQVLTFEISHGMPSSVSTTNKAALEKSYFSNIIVGTEPLSTKNCLVVPTNVVNSTWTQNNDLYVSTDVGQIINQKVDMDALNKINPLYVNTKIDAMFMGSDIAYSEGTNNIIKFGVNGTAFDVKSLANQKYQGVKSKILIKDPSVNDFWTQDRLKNAVFSVTSTSKTEG